MLFFAILPHEGRFLETILKAEQGMASRGCWLVTDILERFGKSARQALRPGCEELRCTAREEMPEMEARPQTQNRHGGAPKGARSSAEGRKGASQAPGTRRYRVPTGCRCIRAPVGAPPTPHRVEEIGKDPGAMRRGNEMCCLSFAV